MPWAKRKQASRIATGDAVRGRVRTPQICANYWQSMTYVQSEFFRRFQDQFQDILSPVALKSSLRHSEWRRPNRAEKDETHGRQANRGNTGSTTGGRDRSASSA